MIRGLRLALVVAAVALLAACSGSPHPAGIRPGNRAIDVAGKQLVAFKKDSRIPDCPAVTSSGVDNGMPGVTLPCLGGGRSVDVAGLRGPMIVNFWASWCGECRREMPALAAYARSHPSVKVIGIDFLDPQPAAALQLAASSGVHYPLLADISGELDRASPLPHIGGLPRTVFLAVDGSVAHIEAGTMVTEQDVAAASSRYLGAGG
jgi:thiol-disulfide isomerase/thioredoxin